MTPYAKHGLPVRLVYLLIACAWWAGAMLRRKLAGHCRGTVVLCYHGISDWQRARFRRQMTHIASRAVDAVHAGRVHRTRGRLPGVCVTFDDSFANLCRNALPIMQQLEVPATLFAVTGNLAAMPRWPMPADHPDATEPTMSGSQLRDLQSALCRIGSHTQNHRRLTTLPPEQLLQELTESRCQLKTLLDRPIHDLALPFGDYNRRVIDAARRAGYRRIFTLDPCLEPLAEGVIGRFSAEPEMWPIEFRLTCAGAYAWLRPWRRFVRRIARARGRTDNQEPALV